VNEWASYPGGESFEPWQDHEWPEHCGVPAGYLGEVGERELSAMADGDIEAFLRDHDAEPSFARASAGRESSPAAQPRLL
jgi:uncharacterized protein CbrC (UPF0167 family)